MILSSHDSVSPGIARPSALTDVPNCTTQITNQAPVLQSAFGEGGTRNTYPPTAHQLHEYLHLASALGASATPIASKAKPPSNIEIATDFIPVTYGGAANLADGGRMVRVELPRSAMASFGLPVNMDRANEKVKADVLMGVDGLAHAIRFVR